MSKVLKSICCISAVGLFSLFLAPSFSAMDQQFNIYDNIFSPIPNRKDCDCVSEDETPPLLPFINGINTGSEKVE